MKSKYCTYCGRELFGDNLQGFIILKNKKYITCCDDKMKELKLDKLK